jgi:hypothetical protein
LALNLLSNPKEYDLSLDYVERDKAHLGFVMLLKKAIDRGRLWETQARQFRKIFWRATLITNLFLVGILVSQNIIASNNEKNFVEDLRVASNEVIKEIFKVEVGEGRELLGVSPAIDNLNSLKLEYWILSENLMGEPCAVQAVDYPAGRLTCFNLKGNSVIGGAFKRRGCFVYYSEDLDPGQNVGWDSKRKPFATFQSREAGARFIQKTDSVFYKYNPQNLGSKEVENLVAEDHAFMCYVTDDITPCGVCLSSRFKTADINDQFVLNQDSVMTFLKGISTIVSKIPYESFDYQCEGTCFQ